MDPRMLCDCAIPQSHTLAIPDQTFSLLASASLWYLLWVHTRVRTLDRAAASVLVARVDYSSLCQSRVMSFFVPAHRVPSLLVWGGYWMASDPRTREFSEYYRFLLSLYPIAISTAEGVEDLPMTHTADQRVLHSRSS